MKFTKIIVVLLFLLTISLAPTAQAATPASVNVTVEGKPLEMPVPPVIVQDRTLVGVRFVGEAVGGTVEWEPVKRQALITRGADTVVITIGQKEALVNGKTVVMEVPAQIVDDRTMVPLRFIAEVLGSTVEWNALTRTANILRKPSAITGLTYSSGPGKTTVTVNLSDPLLSLAPKTAGNSVVLELYPATIDMDQSERVVYDALMKLLQLKTDGRTVRLEAHLWNAPSYRHSLSADGRQITVEFDHTVTAVRFQQEGRIQQVTIAASGKLAADTFQLSDPPRLVVDLAGARRTADLPETVEVGKPHVTLIRTGPKEPDGTRVVLDMPVKLPYDILNTDLGLQVQFVPRIQAIKTERIQGKTRLTLEGNLPMDSTVTVQAAQKKLLIEVPQGRSDLKQNVTKIGDGTVDTVTVSQGAARNSTLITVTMPYYSGHTVVSKNGDANIIVDLVSSPVFGKRIWIDAGHGKIPGGADDPGSIGLTYKTYEKHVNLQVALELQKRLQDAGAIVYMSRNGDEGLDFRERPSKVNALKPPIDLFVSIHHNSATAAVTRGIETYYWTTNPKSRAAAEKIHAALVKKVGFPDRRVRMEPFVVIKETRAPSVLLELGYLSNPDEEKAIAEPGASRKEYPARAADGIRDGIFDYFWQEIR